MNKVNHTIILKDVRCSFVFVTRPNKNGKYQVQPLVPKDSPQAKKLLQLENKLMKEAFGENVKRGRLKLPLRDGDEDRDTEEYEGMYFLNAYSSSAPGIVTRTNEPPAQDELEELCFSGAFYHVSINIYSYPSKDGGKPGLAIGLNNIMLRKKGDRLDGRKSATSEFAEYAEEETDSNEWDDDNEF
jgi:hypothetical protein